MKSTLSVLAAIKKERQQQQQTWGEQNHSIIEWQAILMEEVGEASKEAVDFYFKTPVKTETGEKVRPANGDQAMRLSRYRKELIQVAAVAVQMIECIDRNGE